MEDVLSKLRNRVLSWQSPFVRCATHRIFENYYRDQCTVDMYALSTGTFGYGKFNSAQLFSVREYLPPEAYSFRGIASAWRPMYVCAYVQLVMVIRGIYERENVSVQRERSFLVRTWYLCFD